jgi:hypothetical protein
MEFSPSVAMPTAVVTIPATVLQSSVIPEGLMNYTVYTAQCGGQEGNLWHPYMYIPRRRHSTFDRNSEISLRKERANKLD